MLLNDFTRHINQADIYSLTEKLDMVNNTNLLNTLVKIGRLTKCIHLYTLKLKCNVCKCIHCEEDKNEK